MAETFAEVLERIQTIDRDIAELHRHKSRMPSDRLFSTSIQLSFDKQINLLLAEKKQILDLPVTDLPAWFFANLESPDSATSPKARSVALAGDLSLPNPSEQDVLNFLREIPKTEIHLHLEACVNRQTLKALYQKNGVTVTDQEFEEKYNFKDLNGFIQVFFFVQGSVKEATDLGHFIDSLAEYMRSNNIIYVEAFFAPSKFIQNGLDFDEMVEILISRIRQIESKEGLIIRLLVDVSRSFGPQNAMNNLDRVLKVRQPEVVGIGLGGAELMGPAKDYAEVFKIARESGLRCVAHSGEDDGPWAIWDAVKLCQAERIGHGISAIQDPELVLYLKENNIPIEICVTSNVFTGKYVRKEENHPVRHYFDQGLKLCVNTDDPEIFNVDLSYEYFKFYKYLHFSIKEILELVRQSVDATFYPEKEKLWKSMQEKIEKIKGKYNLT